jgi:hypothetical protein
MNQFKKDNRYIKIINELVSGRMIDQYEFKDLIEMMKNLSKVGGTTREVAVRRKVIVSGWGESNHISIIKKKEKVDWTN